MTTMSNDSNGVDYSDTMNELQKELDKLNDKETRAWLLKTMKKRGVYTNDIMSFIKQQGKNRCFLVDFDRKTADSAMHRKIKDAKASMLQQKNILLSIKRRILEENSNRRFILKKMIKQAKNNIQNKQKKREKRYNKKIDRYLEQQALTVKPKNEGKNKAFTPTKVPSRLNEFGNLCIFGTPKDLPRKQ